MKMFGVNRSVIWHQDWFAPVVSEQRNERYFNVSGTFPSVIL
jgi:hypothetical protein